MRNYSRLWALIGNKMSDLDELCNESFSKCINVMFNELTSEFELHLKCLDSANQIIREEYQTFHELLSSLQQGEGCGKNCLSYFRGETCFFGL